MLLVKVSELPNNERQQRAPFPPDPLIAHDVPLPLSIKATEYSLEETRGTFNNGEGVDDNAIVPFVIAAFHQNSIFISTLIKDWYFSKVIANLSTFPFLALDNIIAHTILKSWNTVLQRI